ncbi:MAG: folylpolyglutamate synthase/dihydrofolate synthase family protein [Bacillota bacterium]|nr:folylpolyglutamate synthase/dihydrofolate synthase family protein [Bacillota bacterium]
MLGSKPGLERIEALLQLMGNPQEGVPYVHIAGTNGKGSTSLMIATALMESGYRVGRFISPHLHSYFERLTVDNEEIEPERFLSYLDRVENKVPFLVDRSLSHPTEFEVLTAAAFQYFKDEDVDVAVLEVGMGGIYDSTNVIVPEVSVITGIDFDHTGFLGDTLSEIAWNKAGIIKMETPVVVGEMKQEALGMIQEVADAKNALLLTNQSVQIRRNRLDGAVQVLDIASQRWDIHGVEFSLAGAYQLKNLATAVVVLEVLCDKGYHIDESAIIHALGHLKMPGRFEIIQTEPLAILDAAHNPQGARALADTVQEYYPGREKILLCGVLNDKELGAILNPLIPNSARIVVTRPKGFRGSKWERMGRYVREQFPEVCLQEIEDISEAVRTALSELSGEQYLLITGSFYVLDEARRYFLNC